MKKKWRLVAALKVCQRSKVCVTAFGKFPLDPQCDALTCLLHNLSGRMQGEILSNTESGARALSLKDRIYLEMCRGVCIRRFAG